MFGVRRVLLGDMVLIATLEFQVFHSQLDANSTLNQILLSKTRDPSKTELELQRLPTEQSYPALDVDLVATCQPQVSSAVSCTQNVSKVPN